MYATGARLIDLIHQAGFTGQSANIMYAIVMAESGGNTAAFNGNSGTGDQSYGLAQINMLGSMGPSRRATYGLSSNSDLFNPLTNLRVAYRLSNGGRDFSPWTTFTRGTYQQYLGQSGARVSSSRTASASTGGGGSRNMRRSDFLNAEGLGELLDMVPELRRLVNRAAAQDWSIEKFQNKIEDSRWWRTHSVTARATAMEKANDPATFHQNLRSAEFTVAHLSRQLGMRLNAHQTWAIAVNALMTGNTDNTEWLTSEIGQRHKYEDIGKWGVNHLTGGMAATVQQLRELAGQYGFHFASNQLAMHAKAILLGDATMDTYKQRVVTWAKSAFPGLARQLDRGATVQDLADPYVSSMSQLLEIDPGKLSVFTPKIRQALQYRDPADKKDYTTMPLWMFEQRVRSDPRWQYTKNANQEAASLLGQLGQAWGFNG